MKHAAIISISTELLLKMLDFKGGIIHRVYTEDDYLEPKSFNVVIEHPDMPEVKPNERLEVVFPMMQSYYGEDGSLIKVVRIEPPKLAGDMRRKL